MSETASNLNDFLSEDEICLITKVPKRAKDRVIKQIEVLNKAGIHFWLGFDGSVCTTKYHVHNARPRVAQNDSAAPAFGKTK